VDRTVKVVDRTIKVMDRTVKETERIAEAKERTAKATDGKKAKSLINLRQSLIKSLLAAKLNSLVAFFAWLAAKLKVLAANSNISRKI